MTEFKCKSCGYKSKTEGAMQTHVKEKHIGFSWWGIGLGIILGYGLEFVVAYLLGYIIALAISGFIFIRLIEYSQKQNDRFLRGVSIGGFGVLLGLLLYWIIEQGAKKTKGYKLIVFIISWLIFMVIGFIIYSVISATPTTVDMGSIYNYSLTTQQAICQNNTIYLQNLLSQRGINNYTILSTYCVGNEAYMTEKYN